MNFDIQKMGDNSWVSIYTNYQSGELAEVLGRFLQRYNERSRVYRSCLNLTEGDFYVFLSDRYEPFRVVKK